MARVTLKHIAKEAGVSIATCSLALRDTGQITREKTERIRAVADRLGYVPNPILSSLASKRFRSAKHLEATPLALFICASEQYPNKGAIYQPELENMAKSYGYQALAFDLTQIESTASLSKNLFNRGVQGIIIIGSPDESLVQEFDWSRFSVVQCARFATPLPFHIVRPNIFQAVKLAVNQLLDRGYERIGFAFGRHPSLFEDDEARWGAALGQQLVRLKAKNRIPLYTGELNVGDKNSDGFREMTRWLKKNKPDAVIGFSAAFVVPLIESGLKIPDDIGFISLHLNADEKIYSGLTQQKEKIAHLSIKTLDTQIRYAERGIPENPIHHLVASEWIENTSLRAI